MEELPPKQDDKFITWQFSWKRIGKIVAWVAGIGIIVGGAYFFVTSRPVKIFWADRTRDRRENFLDCSDLPFFQQAKDAFSKNSDVVAKVKAVTGVVDFYPETIRCDSSLGNYYFIKGQAVLVYKDRAAREAAEKNIRKRFFWHPVPWFSAVVY